MLLILGIVFTAVFATFLLWSFFQRGKEANERRLDDAIRREVERNA